MTYPPPVSGGLARAFFLLVCSLFIGAFPAFATRFELDLGGTWQYAKVPQLTYPPTNAWQTTTVPGYLSGWQNERAWFRTTFTPPSTMAGSRMRLRFGGVKYNSQVWVNGVFVGSYLNGYEPFELDVTGATIVGGSNELVIGVCDWSALFSSPVDFGAKPADQNARDYVKNTVTAPMGGRYEQFGIWQPVKLVSVPAVSIEDVFVTTSVRLQQFTARITLRNDSASPQTITLSNRVFSGTSVSLGLPPLTTNIPPATNLEVTVSTPWPSALLWSPQSPHLYQLETVTTGSAGQDQVRTRFGFREFWVQNGRFFLNGTPINLLASSTWPPSALQTTNQIIKVLTDVKNGNNVAIRFHTQPWDAPWYDMADELGLLVVEEFAVWCDPWAYKLDDPLFWTNYTRHVNAAVKRDRNHPSLILWSLENEILHCGGERAYTATESQLAAVGRAVKAADPSRPITFEADLDPDGEADVLGLHYPYEFPDHHLWPNSAWWMDQSIARDWVPGGRWTWDRAKPLYIGEFGWVPTKSPSEYTILFGDDAYADASYYRNQAKGLTWKMQIEAFRAYGVNGICPWTMFEDPVVPWGVFELSPTNNFLYQVQKAAYHPNGVYPEEYNTRFFAGETVARSLRIYNDRPWTNALTLRWRVNETAWQSRGFTLPPAGQQREVVTFNSPTPGPFMLNLELRTATNLVFSNSIPCTSHARTVLSWPGTRTLGVYDPVGTTVALLNRFSVPHLAVTNLQTADYASFGTVLIGRHAFASETIPDVGRESAAGKWQDFARNGGWILILEQTNYPTWLPGELRIASYDATYAFPTAHEITANLSAEDLRYWATDHRLVANSLVSPHRGNARVIAGVGSRKGMENAAALELILERGGILCSQWLASERFDTEPMAGVLLQRVLNYVASGTTFPPPRPAGLLTETNSTPALRLAEIGLQAENLLGRMANLSPSLHPVLVVAGDAATWQEATASTALLANYVTQGGRLVLHRPPTAFLTAGQSVLFPEIEPVEANLSQALRRDSTNALHRVTNHDLRWVDKEGDWDTAEVLVTNLATRYYRKKFTLTNYTVIQVETMPTKTSGGSATGGWNLWANGYVAQNINVTQSGTYLFNVLARGTPVTGVWPHMVLRIDGRAADSVFVTTNQLAWFSLSTELTAGTHELALVFDNDAYAPPEDRNLVLDEIRWGRDSDNSPVQLLTSPGAVVQVNRGAGCIILDEINWPNEARNSTKASRYVSSLLTSLGASLRLPTALNIEAEAMTNVNVNAFSTGNGMAYLNSNGRIETTVRVTTAGTYTFEIYAGGNLVQGGYPQVGIVINGATRTNFFLTAAPLSRYTISLSLSAGTNRIGLAFMNDLYVQPDDRNLFLDRFSIIPEPSLRITSFTTNPAGQSAAIQWESQPGKRYDVQVSPTALPNSWLSTVTNTSMGTISSWEDTGSATGSPPLSPAAPVRFYRIRQVP